MVSVNKVILVGRLGQDPKIIQGKNGKFANLNLATSESWKNKTTRERKELTEWHNIVLNTNQLAEFVEKYCKKGTQLYIEGSLRTREWEDKNGIKKYTTEVVCGAYNGKVMILSAKEKQAEEVIEERDTFDDEIPF